MKKLGLILTVAAAGLSMFATEASAQRIVVETPGGRVVAGGRGGDRRVGYELDQLNREIRQARSEVRAFRGEGRRIRFRLERVERAAGRLNYEYERRISSSGQIRRRIQQLRAELDDIRRDLRVRGDGPRGWR